MKRRHLLSIAVLFLLQISSFSQVLHPAGNMTSERGNFTSLSTRPVPQPSADLLKAATRASEKHPDFGVLPLNAPCKDCYEVVEKRTETSRYYVINGTGGSEFYSQQSRGAINYKDQNGYFREKDVNIYATAQPGLFESDRQEEPVSIDLNAQVVTIKGLGHNEIKFNSELELWGVDQVGRQTLISAADWKAATVGSDGLSVNDIFKGITMEAFALSGSVKTNFIIHAYSAAYSQYKWLVIKDNVSAGSNSALHFTGVADANGLYNCDADIVSNTSTMIAKIHQGIIFDHSRNSKSPLYYRQEAGKFAMYIDVDYLKNTATNFPVIVDPLVSTTGTLAQASITGSQQDNSGACTFVNSCDFPLTLNSPANATITDVTFSMSYRALGACYEQDGGMRVGYGACVSPSTTGFYYFCNIVGPGTCNGTNISIFADISSCIPAPSCAPYPMTFYLKMFRDCYGAAGCTAGCIQANSPFVVNVYGKTLETLSNTSTGNGTTIQTAGCSGTATLNPTPLYGVGPYTYTWTPGGSNVSPYTVTVTTAQTITCNVTDGCGVVRAATFTVNPNPSTPYASSLPTKTLTPCATTATFAPSYTTTITTYQWSGPGITGAANGASVTVNQAGTYVLTFTNSAGCSGSNTYTAVNGPPTSTASAVSATITCTNPTATLAPVYTPSGNLTYSWAPVGPGTISGSATGPSVVVSQPGVYQVTMTNTVSGCSSTASYTVVNGAQTPTISSIATQTITCPSPTVTLSPTYNPSAGTSYSWTGPGITLPLTTPGISTTQAGNYTVVATAANGCTATAQYSVTGSSVSPTVSIQGAPLTCTGPVTLSTTVTPPGTYTYTWTGPGITSGTNASTVTVNAAGAYNVNITNAFGCTATSTYTVANNASLPSASAVSGTISCINTTATLSPVYTPSGNLTYTWTPVGPGAISGSANNSNVVVTQPGTYQVAFTNTLTGCQSTNTYTVTNDTQAPGISAIPTQTITCTTPTIGIAPTYTPGSGLGYSWSGPGITGTVNTASISTTQAGTYTVLATAANGCTATAQYNVTGSTASPSVSIQGAPLTCTGPVTLSTTITPPSGTYTYTWTGPGITAGVNSSTASVNAPGTYTIVIMNEYACTASNTFTVANNAGIPTASAVSGTINCINTTATLSPVYTPSGNLTYTWMPVGPGAISGSANNPSVTISQPGTYQVAFTNTLTGCQSSNTYTVTDDTQVPAISPAPTQSITCTTPTLNIAPTYTPSAGLSYSWAGPGITGPVATASISVTQGGTYTVTATAANGCSATAQYQVVDNSALPTVSIQGGTLTCSGPLTLSLTVTPPTGTYTYTWTGPGITAGVHSSTATVNAAGAYQVTITNAYGCTATNTYTVANNSNVPTASSVSATITCSNPTATLSPVYSPTTGLTYSWTPVGPGAISGSSTSPNVVVSQPGVYQVAFTNTLTGCQSSHTYTVANNTQAPVISSVPAQTVTCANPSVSISPSYTPSTGLSYSWSGPGITVPVTTSGISTSLAGTYTVVATAANGCTATAQYTVVVNATPVTASAQGTVLPCNPAPAPIGVSASPAGTYTYSWSGPGITSGGNTATPNVNAAGNYTVIVTAANGCTAAAVANVSSQAVTAGFTPANATGTAPFSVSFSNQSQGATSYAWTFGNGATSSATDPSNTYLATGSYTVMLVASNGTCSDTAYALVMVEESAMIEVPNVFTPNGDNINDVFKASTQGIKDLDMTIYNRWGEVISSSSGIQASWNGTQNGKTVSEGTYFYVIKATGFDEKTYDKKGSVNVFK